MLHIILLILKILGIILLSIIGIVLAIVLLVLFSPIRYRVQSDYYRKPHMEFHASYLLHIIRATGCYKNDEFILQVKALWFTIYQIPESKVNEREKKDVHTSKPVTKSKEKTVFDDQPIPRQQSVKTRQQEENVQDIIPHSQNDASQQKADEIKQTISLSQQSSDEKDVLQIQEVSQEKEKIQKINKLKTLLQKIRKVPAFVVSKIIQMIKNMSNLLKGVYHKSEESVSVLKAKIESLNKTIHDEDNRELVVLVWTQAKKLYKLLKPKKYRIRIRYGFEDSSLTGWLAVRLAVIYGLLGLDAQIIPDFDRQVIEGEVFAKGRCCLFPIVVIAIRLYRNKILRKFISR